MCTRAAQTATCFLPVGEGGAAPLPDGHRHRCCFPPRNQAQRGQGSAQGAWACPSDPRTRSRRQSARDAGRGCHRALVSVSRWALGLGTRLSPTQPTWSPGPRGGLLPPTSLFTHHAPLCLLQIPEAERRGFVGEAEMQVGRVLPCNKGL